MNYFKKGQFKYSKMLKKNGKTGKDFIVKYNYYLKAIHYLKDGTKWNLTTLRDTERVHFFCKTTTTMQASR